MIVLLLVVLMLLMLLMLLIVAAVAVEARRYEQVKRASERLAVERQRRARGEWEL